MSKIELGRYSDLLRRALGMKGVQEVAGELSPEISAVWNVESDLPEWQFLKAVRLVSGAGGQGPVVGQNFTGRLRNPPDSGVIATVNHVSASPSLDSGFILRFRTVPLTGDFATLEQSGARDGRWGIPTTSISPLIVSSTTSATPQTGGFLLQTQLTLAGTEFKFGVPVVMPPGSTLMLSSSTQNLQVVFSFHWTERQLPILEAA